MVLVQSLAINLMQYKGRFPFWIITICCRVMRRYYGPISRFRLYGPLASWGLPAVGGDRQTGGSSFTFSYFRALLSASLGINRKDESKLLQLQQSVLVATKQLVPSMLLRDFHTAQVPSKRKNITHPTRRSELAEKESKYYFI